MGKQSGSHYIGRDGPLIGYMWKQIACVRSMPAEVRQTDATKRSATKFGASRKLAKTIRHGLSHILPDAKDRKTIQRLDNALYQWLLQPRVNGSGHYKSIHGLNGFSFSEEKSQAGQFPVMLSINWQRQGEISIVIPPLQPLQHIIAPVNTVFVELHLTAFCCSTNNYRSVSRIADPVRIAYSSGLLPAQQIILPLDLVSPGIALIAGRVKYFVKSINGNREVFNLAWMPSGIMDAVFVDGLDK